MGEERIRYSHDFATVYATLTNADYLRTRAQASGESSVEVRVRQEGNATVIEYDRDIETDLPAFAKKMFNPKNRVIERQTWRDAGDGKEGEFSIDIKGTPATISGRFTLKPVDGGTEHVIRYDPTVKVPLIGKKLEQFVGDETSKGIREDFAYNERHIG